MVPLKIVSAPASEPPPEAEREVTDADINREMSRLLKIEQYRQLKGSQHHAPAAPAQPRSPTSDIETFASNFEKQYTALQNVTGIVQKFTQPNPYMTGIVTILNTEFGKALGMIVGSIGAQVLAQLTGMRSGPAPPPAGMRPGMPGQPAMLPGQQPMPQQQMQNPLVRRPLAPAPAPMPQQPMPQQQIPPGYPPSAPARMPQPVSVQQPAPQQQGIVFNALPIQTQVEAETVQRNMPPTAARTTPSPQPMPRPQQQPYTVQPSPGIQAPSPSSMPKREIKMAFDVDDKELLEKQTAELQKIASMMPVIEKMQEKLEAQEKYIAELEAKNAKCVPAPAKPVTVPSGKAKSKPAAEEEKDDEEDDELEPLEDKEVD